MATREDLHVARRAARSGLPQEEADDQLRQVVETLLLLLLPVIVVGVLSVLPPQPPSPSPTPTPIVEAELLQLPWGVWIDAVLDDEGRDVWEVASPSGTMAIVEANADAFGASLQLRLPTGEEVASAAMGASYLQAMLSDDEVYVVEVTAQSLGAYRIRAREVVPVELDWGKVVEATLGVDDGGEGVWRVESVSGGTVVVEVSSGDFDTIVRLISTTGEEIAQNDDISDNNRDSRLHTTLPGPGVYVLEVTAFPELDGSRGEGGYEIRAREIVPEALDWSGRVREATLGGGDEEHGVWIVEGAAGQMISVEAQSNVLDTSLRVLSATGEEIARSEEMDSGSARVRTILPREGSYMVEVTAVGEKRDGRYTVRGARGYSSVVNGR